MTRFTVVAMLGFALVAPPAFADQNTSQERRRAECTDQVAHNQHFAKRQEFLDFCLAHTDVEVKRYWVCSSRADKANLGTDSRRGFLDWCVEEENYADAQAGRFSYCNARATNQNLKRDDREEFVNGCVERGEVSDDLWGSYQACFARADELKLAGGDRRDFVNWCVDRGNSYNASYSDRYRDCDSRAQPQVDR